MFEKTEIIPFPLKTNLLVTKGSDDGLIKIGESLEIEIDDPDKRTFILWGMMRVGTKSRCQQNDVRHGLSRKELIGALTGVEVILNKGWARTQVDELQKEIEALEVKYQLNDPGVVEYR